MGLTYDSELAKTVLVAFAARHRRHLNARDPHGTAVRSPQARDQLKQRRLARPARPVQRNELTRRDCERNAVYGADRLVIADPIMLYEIAYLEHA